MIKYPQRVQRSSKQVFPPRIVKWLRSRSVYSIVLVLSLISVLLSRLLWLPVFYRFLDVNQPPRLADVIVILGGSGGPRELYAVDLYQQGYAPKVLVSGYADSLAHSLELVVKEDVSKEDILVNDQATTTYNEAEQVLVLLLEMNATSALVVTDRFHTRRAAATYNYVFQEHDIELTFVSPDDGVDPSNWWNARIRDQVVSEYIKMLYYGINYGVWPW